LRKLREEVKGDVEAPLRQGVDSSGIKPGSKGDEEGERSK